MSLSLKNTVTETPLLIRSLAKDGRLREGTTLIGRLGKLLKLRQTTIATTQTIFTRFYCVSDPKDYPIKDTVLAALFLASKVEESSRRIKDIVNVYFALKMFDESNKTQDGGSDQIAAFVDVPYDVFTEYKDAIIRCEIHILARLGFNVHVQHPHGFMVNYLQSLGLAGNKDLAQYCWNSLNDLVQTEVVAYFQPNVIACAVIYYGARIYKVSLPVLPPWWELFDAELHEIETICEHLGHLYHQKDK